MKGIWRGDNDPLGLLYGKTYEILGFDCDGLMVGVVDETGISYLYPTEEFEMTEGVVDDDTGP